MVSITIIDINPSLMFFRSEEKIKMRIFYYVKFSIICIRIATFTNRIHFTNSNNRVCSYHVGTDNSHTLAVTSNNFTVWILLIFL